MIRPSSSVLVAVLVLIGMALASPPASAQAGKSIPGVPGRPVLSLPDDVDLAALKLPASIRPGLRLTYHAGDAVVAGVRTKLVPAQGPGGQWIDPQTGKTYNDEAVRGSGGVGYHQLNIVAASAQLVAAEARNFAIVDQQRNITASGNSVAVGGNAASIGIHWVHPQLLARISAEGALPQPAGVQLFRGPYPLAGRQFNSVAITAEYSNGFSRAVYDVETGFLLFAGSSTAGEAAPVVDPQGKVTPGQGNTMINHMIYTGARQLELPWVADPMPNWVAKGGRLSYRGGMAAVTGGMLPPLPPLGTASTIEFGDVHDGAVTGRLTVMQDIGRGLPAQQSTETRVFGSALANPLWILPATQARLQPNQVIDEDPVTRFRTTFIGVNNGMAGLVEQGPAETNEYFYDTTSGVLAAIRSTRQTQVSQTRIELVLQRN